MLSLCMIVKNEEKQIKDFLEHIYDCVDEIIIVDTGSSDDTKKIAATFPKVKTYDAQWENDFAKARNKSLKYAKGEWILVLDADERISKKDQAKISGLIKKERVTGFFLIQRNYTHDPHTRYFVSSYGDAYAESKPFLGWTEHHVVRLFQNKPEIFYCFKVHELVEPSIEAAQGKVKESEIPIHHYGHVDLKSVEKKFGMYAKICEQKCKDNPEDERAWFEHGINQLKLKKYKRAKDCFERVYVLNRMHPLVCAYLVEVYGLLQDAIGVISSFQRGVQSNPLDVHLYLNIGAIFFVNKKWKEAAKAYQQAIEVERKNSTAWFGAGMSYYHLGEQEKAKQALKQVLKLYPEHPKAKELLEKMG